MIYFDNAAGTRPYPEVIEIITDVLANHWGNASADNSFGKDAMSIIDQVTNQVADDINCKPEEILWTSGACEANSLAIHGLAKNKYLHIFTSKLEHTSINIALKNLNPDEYNIDFIANDNNGFILLDDLEYKLSNLVDNWHMPFVSVSFANSEIGTIQNIKPIADIVHKHNGLLHVDATQMYPWAHIDVKKLGIDLMSVSGQKLNCVKGVGFLYVRGGVEISPIIYGSQQEERRGGTYPTHLIAAFGKALEINRKNELKLFYVAGLRDHLLNNLLKIDGVHLNGCLESRLPNNMSLTIDGVKAEMLTTMCDLMGIIIAKGSACKSHEPKPSETLLSIGLTEEDALNTIRISLDTFNTASEIDMAADIITRLISRIRSNNA